MAHKYRVEDEGAPTLGQRYTVKFPKTDARGLGVQFYKASAGSTSRHLVVKRVVPDKLASTLSPAILPYSVVVEVNGVAVSGRNKTFKAVAAMAKDLPGSITFALPELVSDESDDEVDAGEGEEGEGNESEAPSVGLLFRILNDPRRAEDMVDFYEQTMEDNDLRFILAVSDLERDKDLEHFDGKSRLSAIYSEFLLDGANSEIQLPPRIMSGIKRCFRGIYPKGRAVRGSKQPKYNTSVFNKAQKIVANKFAVHRLHLYLEHKHAKKLRAFIPAEKDERIEAKAVRMIQGVWRKKKSRDRIQKKVENLASKARLNPGSMTVAERRYLARQYAAAESRAAESLRPPRMDDEEWNLFRQSIKVLYT